MALACVLAGFFLAFSVSTSAAKRAAELGPEVSLTEPSGGFVGQINVAPGHGPAGTALTVTGEGFPAGQEFELVWRTVGRSRSANITDASTRRSPIGSQR